MDGGSIPSHEVTGAAAGEPVLLLNGGMMTWAAWGTVAERLERHHRVVRFDFRGQARTPGPAPTTLEGHAEDAVRLLDHLEIPAAHLVGTSFGALVGSVVAGRHPGRALSFVAATAVDRSTPETRESTRSMRRLVAGVVAGGDRGAFHERLLADVFSTAWRRRQAAALEERRRQLDLVPAAWFVELDRILAAVEDFDLGADLAAIACPTLVVLAGDDAVMPAERSRAMAAAIPGAAVAVHPEAGHALVAEDPGWLADEVERFLERVGG